MDISFNTFLWIWLATAAVTFVLLFFISAPYGRHNRKGWGPQIDNKWGWFFMEIVSPSALVVSFLMGWQEPARVSYLFLALWLFHYSYRTVYFPLKINTKGKKMPLAIVLMAVFFNSINGGTNGYFFGQFGNVYESYSLFSFQFVVGFGLFVTGFITHFTADKTLINLRKNNSEYVIPNSGLFRQVASPNYLGEITQWLGFAVLTNSFAAWCFLAWTIANLLPRAVANRNWYRERFPEFPKNRKILIPYLF